MKKTLLLSILGAFALLVSCSEPTEKEKIETVVKTYLSDLLKDEQIDSYSIDSLIVDNVTEKQKLEKEAFEYRDLVKENLAKAKELGVQYQLTNLKTLKDDFEVLQQDIKAYSQKAQETAKKSLMADSLEVLYYDVTAKGTIISTKNVQKNAIFPFHISKDYKILKEPLELRQKSLSTR